MTQSEIVYRPPLEAKSVLLPVTSGCTYGKCTFCECSAEHSKPFSRFSLEEIRQSAKTLAKLESEYSKTSAFLLGENVLALPTAELKKIFSYVHELLPNVTQINLYARAYDVNIKTAAQLTELKSLGMTNLYIGVESGCDEILRWCNKGETKADLLEAFHKLDELGLAYHLSSIIGLGGQELWEEHALATTALYNQIHPKSIRLLTLTPLEGTPLHKDLKSGNFKELEPAEALMEELFFLDHLTVKNCLFVATHITNNVPLAGMLPTHKKLLMDSLIHALQTMDLESLSKVTPDYL